MSATLTWSEYHGASNLQSTFSATNQGAMQLLNEYFATLAGFADFPWQICSTELTTSPWYITLKRKSGAAGRIIFVGISASVGSSMNPQLSGNQTWTSVGVRVAWFPSATSDTPANIIAASGDVFTNPSGYTSLSPNAAFTSGTSSFTCWACDDGLFLRYGISTVNTNTLAVGDLLVDSSDDAIGFAGSFGGAIETTTSTLFSSTTAGGFCYIGGVLCHFGSGWVPQAVTAIYGLRDNGAKKLWLMPRSMFSFQLPAGDGFKYKLRQIAFGPTALAGYERIAVDGDVTKAQFTVPFAGSGYAWLANYKV